MYQAGDQLLTVRYSVNGAAFIADQHGLWIAARRGASDWALAPDGKRVAAVIPEGAGEAPQQEHVIVMLQTFADAKRRSIQPRALRRIGRGWTTGA